MRMAATQAVPDKVLRKAFRNIDFKHIVAGAALTGKMRMPQGVGHGKAASSKMGSTLPFHSL